MERSFADFSQLSVHRYGTCCKPTLCHQPAATVTRTCDFTNFFWFRGPSISKVEELFRD
jgi:hypothetical protein